MSPTAVTNTGSAAQAAPATAFSGYSQKIKDLLGKLSGLFVMPGSGQELERPEFPKGEPAKPAESNGTSSDGATIETEESKNKDRTDQRADEANPRERAREDLESYIEEKYGDKAAGILDQLDLAKEDFDDEKVMALIKEEYFEEAIKELNYNKDEIDDDDDVEPSAADDDETVVETE